MITKDYLNHNFIIYDEDYKCTKCNTVVTTCGNIVIENDFLKKLKLISINLILTCDEMIIKGIIE